MERMRVAGAWVVAAALLVACSWFVVVLLWSDLGLSNEANRRLSSQIDAARRSRIVAESGYRKAVSDWVYDNSERIGRATAGEIVAAAFSNPHPVLILSVIGAESRFDPTAVSKKGAVGLGQIMYGVWGKDLERGGIIRAKRDLFGVDENVAATGYVLGVLMAESNGDVIRALTRYLGADYHRYRDRVFLNYVQLSMLRE